MEVFRLEALKISLKREENVGPKEELFPDYRKSQSPETTTGVDF